MRIGIVLLPEHRWVDVEPRWRAAEEWGFDHAWTYDHLAWRSLADGPWLATVPLLTAAAVVTERIRLGTWVASPNFRHPVPFAKDIMGLDDVSAGRLLLGLGAGGSGFDADVLGAAVSPAERAERFEEFCHLMDRLLSQPVTDHEGSWYQAHGARMLPGCVQQPRVPFVVAANGPRAMATAARYGQGWGTYGPSLAGLEETGSAADQERWWAGLERLVERFDRAVVAAGRAPGDVDRYLSVDGAPVYSLSSVGVLTEAVERAAGLGFTDLVLHWPRPDGVYAGDERVLHEAAGRLAELRAVRPVPRTVG
ncbi:LLM class flavin-dependent oxidoreductase [Isoptericola sp. b441]|uniref:LLM class flavin-dependent oxidoreductase n=1 Tax=Actinotalea lenta TaxID=3064654 RepID=A0ABT9D547_9CELL|nr:MULTISPECIES: LLM class flavin-dependent oxidoreductase [unclassified Isoptericola]MDO8105875.1 LLM class flavin-dependent oxidoreductase [Isoptericola sp. b441]MDO8122591.1 LLM class flavin-dependent oxidoreductase [Isoptericola sp. b490]